MKSFYFLIFSLLICANSFAQKTQKLELLDVFNMEYVSDPQISPDGNHIIYVRNFKDVMTDKNLSNLWMVNTDGSRNRPITTGNQNDFSPSWSHDGTRIVFKSNMKDDKVKLYMMWMDSKDVLALTNTQESAGAVSWSWDDTQLAFSMFVPSVKKSIINLPQKPEGAKWNAPPIYIDQMNYRGDGQGYLKSGNDQLFIISTDGGTPRQITFTADDYGNPIWSKDGKSLYFGANLHENHEMEPVDSEIYQFTISTATIKPLTSRKGPDNAAVVSPDGSKIAYTGFDDTYQGYTVTKLYVMNVDGSDSKLLTQDLDRDISNPIWEENGKGLY
ncbi:MAG: S9 family peptidase, partial [Aquaticitalea sp.]